MLVLGSVQFQISMFQNQSQFIVVIIQFDHVNFMFYQLRDVSSSSDHVHHVHGLKIFQDLVIIQCGYMCVIYVY